jgi:hypothetical protein
MEDIHKIFSGFKKEFPGVHQQHEALGKEVHIPKKLIAFC